MKAQDLKNSILQLAIQGKLVEQRADEGTAKELLEQIRAEKEQLIRSGKIKKEKPLTEIGEDEIPFDIPESWEWVRLNDILNFIDYRGKTPNKIDSGVILITASNIRRGFLDFSKEDFISQSEYYERMSRGTTQKGDILFTTEAPLGNVAINTIEIASCGQRVITFQQYGKIQFFNELICFFIQSPFFQQELLINATGTTAKGIKAAKLKNILIPFPPLEEQKRIVAKIEELMPYVEKYGEAHSKLEEFNKKFPQDMQKSILQYAIQGKLVEQREEEGTAEELYKQIQAEKAKLIKEGKIKKEKPLAEITEEEIPFEIPDSWKWVYINEIAFVTKLAGFEYTKYMTNSIFSEGDIPIVRAQNIKPNNFIENEKEFISKELSEKLNRCALDTRCILMTFIGAGIGEVAIFENIRRNHLAPNVAKIVPHIDINDYILFYLMSDCGQREIFKFMKKTAQPSLSMETIRKVMVPLPPLEEQKRIVAKIEELMPYCEQLIK